MVCVIIAITLLGRECYVNTCGKPLKMHNVKEIFPETLGDSECSLS